MDIIPSVKETPEFASLCSFIQLFGNDLNIAISHTQLEKFLEIKDFESTPKQWIDLHRRLLNRIKVKCISDKFEHSLKRFVNMNLVSEISFPDLYDKGYYSISAQLRARILMIIFDCQFDKNVKFKEKVNLRQNKDLRIQPFGSDIHGCIYWFFVDAEVNMIMYKENLEDESFKIIAESIGGMKNVLTELKAIDGDNVDLSKLYLESVTPEDTNSPITELDAIKDEEIDIKPCIHGKVGESQINGTRSPMGNCKSVSTIDVEDIKPLVKEDGPNIDDASENDNKLIISTMDTEETVQITETKIEEIEETENDLKTDEKKKRGRKPKTPKKEQKPTEIEEKSSEIDNLESNLNLRRSERKRKPVNPFTIMYTAPSTKKSKIVDSQNDNTDKAESESNKKVTVKGKDKGKKKDKKGKIKDHSKPGRPKKMKKHSSKDKDSKLKNKLKKKSKHQSKSHKHKQRMPWEEAESSEEHIEEEEEEEELYPHEESDASPPPDAGVQWNDKPESDFDPDQLSATSDEETLKSRGRNYFRQKRRLTKTEKEEPTDDKPCQICLGVNIPEMILLCDDCDSGHHAMCLRPSLMIIPEGDWFCPKCQHKKLINNLATKIVELDQLLSKNIAKIRMQERLNFVNISMTNILSTNRKHRRSSSNDEEDSNSANGTSSPSITSSSNNSDNSSDGSSSSNSEKGGSRGRYKFRESSRKENTRYNFEEIDKMFDNALEDDEKYQLEKKRQGMEESEESEPEYDYSGIEPRKKSSGKDMSNILEEEKPQLRRPTKRKRLTYASDNDDFEDDVKDQDFKLSEQSCSDLEEEEDYRISDNNGSDSDEQWVARTRRSTRKSHRRKEKKHKRRSDNPGIVSRPRRTAARKVNYLEMIGDGDNDEEEQGKQNSEEEEQHSPDFDSDIDDSSNKPPPVLARKKSKLLNRRRKISDSEYEASKGNSTSDGSGSTEELDSVKKQTKKRLCVDSDTDSGRDGGVAQEEDKKEEGENNEEKGENRNEEGEDKKEEGEDRNEEGEDRNEEGDDKEEEGKDRNEEGDDKEEEGKDRNEEGEEDKAEEGRAARKEDEVDQLQGKEANMDMTKEETTTRNEMNNESEERVEKERNMEGKVLGTKSTVEECGMPSLALKNPMRAKDDQDVDVENELESETEEEEEEEDGSGRSGE